MKDWLAERAGATPEALAIEFKGQQVTYRRLQSWVSGFCQALFREGVRAGDRVAVFMPNSLEYAALLHALARIGAVIVPLNIRLTPSELGYQVRDSRAAWLIGLAEEAGTLSGLVPENRLVFFDDRWLKNSDAGIWDFREIDLSEPWGIVYTSGTSGRPKGAVLTYRNIFFSAHASAERLGLEMASCWLAVLPLYHIGGISILFRACLYGTAVLLHDKFDVEEVDRDLESGKATMVSLVPTMLLRLMEDRSWRPYPESLRCILLGGAAASKRLLAACREAGLPVATTYGLSEASSQVATALPSRVLEKPGTVGKPLAGMGLKIIAADSGIETNTGEIGEIAVRGPAVTMGYLIQGEFPPVDAFLPAKSSNEPVFPADAALLQDNMAVLNGTSAYPWFQTGDLGYLDPDGDLWLVQRRSDLIVTGGENVYPAEVEAIMLEHPQVESAHVAGIADEEWGQIVAALVVVDDPDLMDREQLIWFMRRRLAGYKVPRRLKFVEHFPLTSTGKIDRQAAIKMLEGAQND